MAREIKSGYETPVTVTWEVYTRMVEQGRAKYPPESRFAKRGSPKPVFQYKAETKREESK